MFYPDSVERTELSRRVVERVDGRRGVIASGHVADGPDEQLRDVESIAATGVDAVVLVANRFAEAHEPDGLWFERTLEFVERVGTGIQLGLYECPYPYKRVVSIDNLVEIAFSGRFHFLKDTSCVTPVLEERARALEGSRLQLYNAHSATLLECLRCCYAGFSGVMANLHPDLYSWLLANHKTSPHSVEVQDVLGIMHLPRRCSIRLARNTT